MTPPVRLTWKSALGALAMITGPAVGVNMHTCPPALAAALTAGGAFILAAERIAESTDFATIAGPGAAAEIAKVKADANDAVADLHRMYGAQLSESKAALAKATDEITRLAPLEALVRSSLAETAPPPPPPPIAAAPLA